MRTRLTELDLLLLYDTARGFLGLRPEEKLLRHALLSFMGSVGVEHATFLRVQSSGAGPSLYATLARGRPEAKIRIALTRPVLDVLLDSNPARAVGPVPKARLAELPAAARQAFEILGAQWVQPVVRDGRVLGAVALGPSLLGASWDERENLLCTEIAELLRRVWPADGPLPDAGERAPHELDLAEIRQTCPALANIQGEGPATRALLDEILSLSDFDLPVLITGETGTGKEMVARALHDSSSRAGRPFEAINCASVPPELMPSELFGHERGAFTGAVSSRRGAFERAGEGTLFLDEIGDMPLEAQAALLRVLQERQFRRVGGEALLPAHCRVISATNRDLLAEARGGGFRADLLYRVRMYNINIPPLRERKEEIPALVAHLLKRHRPKGGPEPRPSPAYLEELARRPLPGNVRELENLVVTSLVRARRAGTLEVEHLAPDTAGSVAGGLEGRPWGTREGDPPLSGDEGRPAPSASRTPAATFGSGSPPRVRPALARQEDEAVSYREMERDYVMGILQQTGGNKKKAAALMGIPRTTLNARLRRLGIGPTT